MSKEVFLSYASANEDDAEKIRELLFENGIDVWMAKHDIDGLAELYGGKDGLIKKLDEFFSAPVEYRKDYEL